MPNPGCVRLAATTADGRMDGRHIISVIYLGKHAEEYYGIVLSSSHI